MNKKPLCLSNSYFLFASLLLDRQEQLEFWRQFFFRVQTVREVDATNTAVGMNLNTKGFDVVGTVRTTGEVRQVELNLVPSIIKTHWHGANERLHSGGRLVVGSSETSADILIIKDLDFKGEVLFQVLHNHHKEGKLDAKGLGGFSRASDVVGGHIGANDFQNRRLNVIVSDTLDMAVSNLFVPDLQRL